MTAAQFSLRIRIGEHLDLTKAEHAAVGADQLTEECGATVAATGDVNEPDQRFLHQPVGTREFSRELTSLMWCCTV